MFLCYMLLAHVQGSINEFTFVTDDMPQGEFYAALAEIQGPLPIHCIQKTKQALCGSSKQVM